MNINKFIPPFMHRIDNYLLKSKPAVWSTRFHFVAYFTTVVTTILFALLFYVNSDPRESSDQFTWVLLVAIMVVLSVVVFLMYLLRFNVFKRFGEWNTIDSLLSFLFYMLTFASIYFWGFIPSITEHIVANKKYTFTELINDQNRYNTAIAVVEQDSLKFYVAVDDTVVLDTSINVYNRNVAYDEASEDANIATAEAVKVINAEVTPSPAAKQTVVYRDSAQFYNLLQNADSVRILSDSSFVEYIVPDFRFCGQKNYSSMYSKSNEEPDSLEWSNLRLFYEVLDAVRAEKSAPCKAIITAIQDKYLIHEDREDSSVVSFDAYKLKYEKEYNKPSYKEYINFKYYTSGIENRIEHIRDRKRQWNSSGTNVKLHLLFYFSLISALFLWIFRHNNKKPFFLSFLVGGLLFLFSSIFLILTSAHTDGINSLLVFYFLVFLLVGLSIFRLKTQKNIPLISLNFITLTTYFVPLFLVSVWYRSQDRYDLSDIARNALTVKYEHYLSLAEYGGYILLLIAMYFLFSGLYKKWIALPEE
jgi:hypothetical protein